LLFSGQIFSAPPSKMPSRTPMAVVMGGGTFIKVGGHKCKSKNL